MLLVTMTIEQMEMKIMTISETDLFVILGEALDTDPATLTVDTKAEDISAWDSMGHLSILVALDTRLEGKVSEIGEMASANSVKKISDLLRHSSLLK